MSVVKSGLAGLAKLIVVGIAVVAVIAGVTAAIKGEIGDVIDALNPFDTETVDHSGPPVLQSLIDVGKYQAAAAYYEVIVDLEEESKLPDFLKGERVLYIGKGTVDALVDFGKLDKSSVSVNELTKTVRIRLPEPTIGRAHLNLKTSRLYSHDSGLFSKFNGSELEFKAQRKAEAKITKAGRSQGELMSRAKKNTTSMLRGLLSALGYTEVEVTFNRR